MALDVVYRKFERDSHFSRRRCWCSQKKCL